MPKETLTGAEELRRCVGAIDNLHETFNDRYTLKELVTLCRAWRAAEMDLFPDDGWTERQVKEALEEGKVPQWSDDEAPIYNDVGPRIEVLR